MRFDAVLDTCGYAPSAVRAAAAALRDAAWQYCFISSISVYDASQERLDEASSATLALPKDVPPETYDAQYYGEFKMLCEREVTEVLGAERALIIRPGLIVGRTIQPIALATGRTASHVVAMCSRHPDQISEYSSSMFEILPHGSWR